MSKNLTQEQFIKNAKETHGDKYDYNLSNYKHMLEKVKIKCIFHDFIFEQTPGNHLNGKGCVKCVKRTSNTKDFILKATIIHKNKYDYYLVNYINAHTKVSIRCIAHNIIFEQTPSRHLEGRGCIKCGYTKKSTEQFINEAMLIHGNKYDYTLVKYIKNNIKVSIICNDHGSFQQTPSQHLQGQNCRKCYNESIYFKLAFTTEDFIKKSKEIHGNKFDYSLVNYITNQDKVIIICPNKHIFNQRPAAHMAGTDCPICVKSKSRAEESWLNYLLIPEEYKRIIINVNGKQIKPDAFNSLTKTIYEFYGDYWHGNPEKYNSQAFMDSKENKTFGEKYISTMERERLLRDNGYNLITIWENDWNTYLKNPNQSPKMNYLPAFM